MAKTTLTVKVPEKTTAPTAKTISSAYTGGSIVDYIKSTGGDSSFSSRARLAVEHGIVKDASQYVGSASQNTSLLSKLRTKTTSTPSAVNNRNDASNFINGAQADDIARAEEADAPPTRFGSEDLINTFKELTGRNSLLPDSDITTPNFEATYEKMRKEYGVAGIEDAINEYDALEQDIRARLTERVDTEEGKTVALNVIEGRIGETERQEFRRLEEIGRAKQRAVNQLNNANAAIETKMQLQKMDYDVARAEYDTKFNQNLQMFTLVKGLTEFDISEQEREEDNARANLQIMYESIKAGGIDVNNMDSVTSAKISSLELKAGLPIGFYNSIAKANPDGKILSTTTRTSGGVKYADIITQNADGSLSTQQIKLGATNEGSGGTAPTLSEAELSRSARSEIANNLNPRRGSDGYVSPDDYKKARNAWVSKGFAATDFNESFAREYVNPEISDQYGVSLDLII